MYTLTWTEQYALWMVVDLTSYPSRIPVSLRPRSPQTRQFSASIHKNKEQEIKLSPAVLLAIWEYLSSSYCWWDTRDAEASGCPPSSQRASAKLYTPEEKSDRVRQHRQEINDIPKPKWLPFTQIEGCTVGLLLHLILGWKILFYIYFTI